jgi:hypothetical protein
MYLELATYTGVEQAMNIVYRGQGDMAAKTSLARQPSRHGRWFWLREHKASGWANTK